MESAYEPGEQQLRGSYMGCRPALASLGSSGNGRRAAGIETESLQPAGCGDLLAGFCSGCNSWELCPAKSVPELQYIRGCVARPYLPVLFGRRDHHAGRHLPTLLLAPRDFLRRHGGLHLAVSRPSRAAHTALLVSCSAAARTAHYRQVSRRDSDGHADVWCRCAALIRAGLLALRSCRVWLCFPRTRLTATRSLSWHHRSSLHWLWSNLPHPHHHLQEPCYSRNCDAGMGDLQRHLSRHAAKAERLVLPQASMSSERTFGWHPGAAYRGYRTSCSLGNGAWTSFARLSCTGRRLYPQPDARDQLQQRTVIYV